MRALAFNLSLIKKSDFKLTWRLLETSISTNTPAKPMEFVKAKSMLKLCGFSISKPQKIACSPLKPLVCLASEVASRRWA
jgi:hypothetical protein